MTQLDPSSGTTPTYTPPLDPFFARVHAQLRYVESHRRPISALPEPFQSSKSKQRFSRAKLFGKTGDVKSLLKQFLDLFPCRYDYIYQDPGDTWLTNSQRPLSDADIFKAISLSADRLFGCRFKRDTRHARIDIDAGGSYHSLSAMNRIREALTGARLTGHVVYRSSDSGGYHIFIPFEHAVPSDHIGNLLAVLLRHEGFKISKGNLELFPHFRPGSKGQAIRLPLQAGWAFLNQGNLNVMYEREDLSPINALSYFMDDMASNANSLDDLKEADEYVEWLTEDEPINEDFLYLEPPSSDSFTVPREVAHTYNDNRPAVSPRAEACLPQGEQALEVADSDLLESIWKGLPPGGMKWDRWLKGRQYFDTGLTGRSQRNDALIAMSHYLFYGDLSRGIRALGYGHESEREYQLFEWLREKHNGFSEEINEGKADAFKQIERVARWRPRARRQAGTSGSSNGLEQYNAGRKNSVIERITKGVEDLKDVGVKGRNALSKLLGISRTTATKYTPMWIHLVDVWEANQAKGKTQRLISFPSRRVPTDNAASEAAS